MEKGKNLYNFLLIALLVFSISFILFQNLSFNKLKPTGFSIEGENLTNETELNQTLTNESCEEDWECGNWSECIDGEKERQCTDLNSCGTEEEKPKEIETCEISIENNEEDTKNQTEETNQELNQNLTELSTQEITQEQIPTNEEETKSNEELNKNECLPSWKCGDWQSCLNGTQKRICIDKNNCNSQENKPETFRECNETGNCYDHIKNQDETNVDCGGVCKPCGTFKIVGSTISESIEAGKKFVLSSISKNPFVNILIIIAVISLVEWKIFLKIKNKKEDKKRKKRKN